MGSPAWGADPRFATLEARLRHQDALDQAVGAWTATQEAPAAMLARPALMVSAVVLKLAIAPIVFITLGRLAGLDGLHLACLAMIGAAPAPPGAYTLTREMGGDARLMAGLITATTLLSAVMLPLALELAARLAGSGG